MNRFVFARMIGIGLNVSLIVAACLMGLPTWLRVVSAILGVFALLPGIVWSIQLSKFMKDKLFPNTQFRGPAAIKEVWNDLWCDDLLGKDSQMATYNDRKRREKIKAFE